jgi:signal peptidase II
MNRSKSDNSLWILGLAGLVLIGFDILTKYLTYQYLPVSNRFTLWYPYGGIAVFKNFLGIEFSINHTINHGAAWGILSEVQGFLLVLRMIMIAGLIGFLLFFNKHKSWTFPLTLITVGALGNVIDTFVYGHVVDMFHFVLWGYDFPVFNVADICITIGVSWLFVASLLQSEELNNKPYAKDGHTK